MNFLYCRYTAAFLLLLALPLPSALAASPGGEQPVQTANAILDSPRLMSHYLAAEIAVNNGDLEAAFEHYLQITEEADDVSIARRATHIGLHLKSDAVLETASLWTRLAPDDIEAWKSLLLLRINAGDRSGALQAMRSLMKTAEAMHSDGFIQVAAIVAESSNQELGLELTRNLVATHAGDARAHYALALAYFSQKQSEAAEQSLRRALELKKDDPKIWILLARILDAQKRTDDSEALLQQGLEYLPDNDLLRLSYAEHLVIHEKYEQAYREFRLLHESLPENDEITQALGSLAIELNMWSDAREIWSGMMERKDKRDHALYFLAQIEESSGDPVKALDYYSKVGGVLRTDAKIRSAQLLAKQGDLAKALLIISTTRITAMEDAVRLYLAESDLLTASNKSMQAMALLDKALAENPRQVDLLYARGMLGDDMGSPEILERDMRAILEIDAENAQALNALGYTLANLGERLEEAHELISKAYELMPESAAILDSMGWIEFRLGNYAAAEKYLRMAAKRDDDSEIMAHLGEVLWVTGRRDEASSIWQEALRKEPESKHLAETMRRLQRQDPLQ